MFLRILKSASGWGMMSLCIRLLSAAILLPLTTRLLSASELGYWYLFTNFYAAIVVFDFGVTSASSRGMAMMLAELHVAGDKEKIRARLAAFYGSCRTVYKWVAASTFIFLSIGGGWWIWQRTADFPQATEVRHAWLLTCPAFALAIAGNFGRSLLSGTNRINMFQFLSACAFALQFVVGVGGLLAGWGLSALVAANLAMFSVLAIGLPFALLNPGSLAESGPWQRGTPREMRSLLKVSAGTFCNSLSSFIVLNAPVLAASHFLSIEEVGRYGLSLQVILIASQASNIWVEVKGPVLVHLYRANPKELPRVFVQRMRLALATYITCIVGAVLVGPTLLTLIGSHTQILGLPLFLTLATMVFFVLHAGLFDAFCMGLGYNPFIKPYLISAIAGVLLATYFAPALGLWAFILGPLAAQLLWNAWWVPKQGLRLVGITPVEYFSRMIFGRASLPFTK
ncbi:MAG: hypothetical protein ACREKL_16350 [Chthoniobacterales bacterium]